MFYLIYKITNKFSGKFYIGTHKTNNKNDSYMGSGKYLNYAIQKYGLENFTKDILFEYDNSEDMFNKEAEIVNEDFLASENTYNLKKGGNGGFGYINNLGINLYGKNGHPGYGGNNLVDGAYIKDKFINENKWNDYLVKLSQIHKQTYINGRIPSFTNRNHTIESRNKMSISSKGIGCGKDNSQFGTCWITDGINNKKIKINDLDKWPNWKRGRN